MDNGPDPWVLRKDSFYYYTRTFGNRIGIYQTRNMSELKDSKPVFVWTPPDTGMYSKNIWAPEIHFFDGKWYLYFAADDGNNHNHRMYVLENPGADPMTDNWEFKGKISDKSDKWAIDGSVFEYKGQRYFTWSGWDGDVNVSQNIYIAKMKDPLTIEGDRVKIAEPIHDWEMIGTPDVNEGPQFLQNDRGQAFIVYSGSGCWTDDYALGLLSLKENGDPLNAADWTKTPEPVFRKKPEHGAYAPGHNSFFKSPDGREDWIIYHANSSAGQGCKNTRNPRMQKFGWTSDGRPDFGEPVQVGAEIEVPSGE